MDSLGYKKDIWDKSKFKEFRKFMGFSTTGMEREIVIFFQKLRIKKEKIHIKEILERTLFERDPKNMEFVVNFERGNNSVAWQKRQWESIKLSNEAKHSELEYLGGERLFEEKND